jgi:hypothetical protein
MWTKTLKTKFKSHSVDVQIWLDRVDENDKPIVKVQSMVNEYFLEETIILESRDAAYDFIKHYPVSLANAFITREAYSVGAWN